MGIVVGYMPDELGRDALSLAAMMARSSGQGLVVVNVVRRPWPLKLTGADADEQERYAREVFEEARPALGEVAAEFVVERSRSIPVTLLKVAQERDAELVVLGAGRDGLLGNVALSSTANHVVHVSEVAVALPPRGMGFPADARVERVTVSFGGSDRAPVFAVAAAGRAAHYGASLRLVSFLTRSRPDVNMTLGVEGDTAIFETWEAEIALAQDAAMKEIASLPDPPQLEPPQIGRGAGWEAALNDVEWRAGDLMVLGSSDAAPAARVFLGSRANKILKRSPVPVVLLPSGQAERLADQAEEGPE